MSATVLTWPGVVRRTSSELTHRLAHGPTNPQVGGRRCASAVDGTAADAQDLRERRLRALLAFRAVLETALVDVTDLAPELEQSRATTAARLARENLQTFRNQLELLDLLEAERLLPGPERR